MTGCRRQCDWDENMVCRSCGIDYSDPKINVLSADNVSEKYTIVKTQLIATDKKPAVKIDWRIYTKNPDNPLIRDLIIEGLSLARTQKEEFKSILQNNEGDINYLFKSLEEFIIKQMVGPPGLEPGTNTL